MAGTKGQRNGGEILVNLFADDHHFFVRWFYEAASLGKGIAAWTMSVVMRFDLVMLSIGGVCEGDNFN